MLDAEEREGSSRGRLDLLLEQLGADVVSETLEVELGALSGFQSGATPLEGGVLERLNALGESMGMTVDGGQSVRLRGEATSVKMRSSRSPWSLRMRCWVARPRSLALRLGDPDVAEDRWVHVATSPRGNQIHVCLPVEILPVTGHQFHTVFGR